MFSRSLKSPTQKSTLQDMCDEIQNMGDILACYVINREGKLLGASYGQVVLDEDLKHDFNQIAAGVWADLERVTNIGGDLLIVSASYENFKILGFPIKRSNAAVLVTVENKLDNQVVHERVDDFISYWMKVNQYLL